MADATQLFAQKLMDHGVGQGLRTYTPETTLHVALFTTAATRAQLEAQDFTNEVANANGYARESVDFNAVAAGVTDNVADLQWTAAGGPIANIRFFAVVSTLTHGAGEILFYDQFSTDYSLADGESLTVGAGDLDVTITGGIADYLRDALLDHAVGEGARNHTPDTDLHVALFTSTATESEIKGGTLTNELPATNGYARKAVVLTAATLADPSEAANDALLQFPASGGDWPAAAYWAIVTGSARGAGNVHYVAAFDQGTVTVNDGETGEIAAGAATCNLT